jgi:heat shock protein HtpX
MGRDLFNFGKTAILMGAMMGLFVAVGGMFGEGFLIPALLFGGGLNLVAFFFSDTIAIKSMRGREVTAENGGDLYRMVDRAAAAGGPADAAGLPDAPPGARTRSRRGGAPSGARWR